ncbi:MAG: hypothetical protein R3C56_03770 [Pirellulaceae bacterium]
MRTALAWKNLTSDFKKCLLAATGVGFAVVLMFMQIGFRNALIDNNVQLFTLFDPHASPILAMVSHAYNISTEQRFPRALLEQAASIPGVIAVARPASNGPPLGSWSRGIVPDRCGVIAVEMQHPKFFRDPRLFARLEAADAQQGALVDTQSKPAYGFAKNPAELEPPRG